MPNMDSSESNNLKEKHILRRFLQGTLYWNWNPKIDPCDCHYCPHEFEGNRWFCYKLNQGWTVIFPGDKTPELWADMCDFEGADALRAERLIEEEAERQIDNLINEEINRQLVQARPVVRPVVRPAVRPIVRPAIRPAVRPAVRPAAHARRSGRPCRNLYYDETVPQVMIDGRLCHVTREYLTGSTCYRENCQHSHPGDPDWRQSWNPVIEI